MPWVHYEGAARDVAIVGRHGEGKEGRLRGRSRTKDQPGRTKFCGGKDLRLAMWRTLLEDGRFYDGGRGPGAVHQGGKR